MALRRRPAGPIRPPLILLSPTMVASCTESMLEAAHCSGGACKQTGSFLSLGKSSQSQPAQQGWWPGRFARTELSWGSRQEASKESSACLSLSARFGVCRSKETALDPSLQFLDLRIRDD